MHLESSKMSDSIVKGHQLLLMYYVQLGLRCLSINKQKKIHVSCEGSLCEKGKAKDK